MTTINAKYITKLYKNEYALKDCSLEVKSGEFLVIMGHSGCGKTTLLKILAGVEKPTSGELYLDGVIADGIPLKDRDISLDFQEYVLYPNMTVYENVAISLRNKCDAMETYDRVMPVLDKLGLTSAMNQRPKTLSGGQQQRVALAKAMVKKSSLILLDEPLSNVSAQQRLEYCRLLLQLKQQLKSTTFVYVTHNASEALMLADRIAVMKDGRVEYCCDRKNFLYNFSNKDALEVFCGNTKTVNGVWSGAFNAEGITVSSRILKTCRAVEGQPLIAVSNPMDNNNYYLFDTDGRAVGGAVNELLFPARLEGSFLISDVQKIELDKQFLSTLLKKQGNVTACLRVDKLSKVGLPGHFRMLLDVIYNDGNTLGVKWGNNVFYMLRRTNLKEGEQIYMYAPLKELQLYDGDRITAHYPIDGASVPVRVSDVKGVVKILGKKYVTDQDLSLKHRARLSPFALRLADKKQKGTVKVREVLDEDILGDKKLVYCIVDGVDGYCSFLTYSDEICFNRNLRLCLDVSRLTFY